MRILTILGVSLALTLSAFAEDKLSDSARAALWQAQAASLQAEVNKLRAVLAIADKQIQEFQAAAFNATMAKSNCKSIDAEFNCVKGPVAKPAPEAPAPATPKDN